MKECMIHIREVEGITPANKEGDLFFLRTDCIQVCSWLPYSQPQLIYQYDFFWRERKIVIDVNASKPVQNPGSKMNVVKWIIIVITRSLQSIVYACYLDNEVIYRPRYVLLLFSCLNELDGNIKSVACKREATCTYVTLITSNMDSLCLINVLCSQCWKQSTTQCTQISHDRPHRIFPSLASWFFFLAGKAVFYLLF